MPESSMQTERKKTATKTLQPVGKQLSSAWELLKISWKKLLILSVILWAAIFGLAIIGGGTFAGILVAMGAGGSDVSSVATVVVGLILFVVAALVISSVFGTSMLLAINEAKDNPSVGSLINRGFKLFLPVFLTSLIMVFLVYGGVFLFIIPGIVIAILTGLSMFEVVFTKNKYMVAIQNSVKIVSQNFWEIFVRALLVFGIGIAIGVITATIGDSGLGQLIGSIVQMVFSWFVLAFYIVVYKEARALTNLEKKPSMVWIWIVAALGWVFGIFLISMAATALSRLDLPELIESEIQSDYPRDNTSGEVEFDTDKILEEYGQNMTEEEKKLFRQMIENAEPTMQQDQEAVPQEEAI